MRETSGTLHSDRIGPGIALILVAYLFFACVDVSVKWLVTAGIPSLQLAFMRYAGHFAFSLAKLTSPGHPSLRMSGADFWLVSLRGFFLISATAVNFVGLLFLPLTITSAILFSAPIFVCALSGPLLGERVGLFRWTAILIGFVGVLIVVRPFDESFHWAAVMMIYQAVAFALFSIITRKTAGRIPQDTLQFHMGAMGTAVLLVPAALIWTNPASLLDWALMMGIGAWAFIGHGFFIRAHQMAPASTLMPFTYSMLLYVAILSSAIFGDVPDGLTLLGGAVIVCAGLLIWWRETGAARKDAGAGYSR